MRDLEIDEDRMTAVMDRIRRVVGEHEGEIVDEDDWGRRKLAYKIGVKTEAHYHLSHLTLGTDGPSALENSLKLTEDVMRHLLVRQE